MTDPATLTRNIRGRPFILDVDSGSRDEPPTRTFGSLDAAVLAMEGLDERWQRFAWIVERDQDDRPIVHVRDGKRVAS